MQLSIGRKLTISFALMALALLAVGAVALRSVNSAADAAGRSARTHQILALTDSTATLLRDADWARHASIASGDESHTRTIDEVALRLGGHIARLGALTAADSIQQRRVRALAPLVDRRLRAIRDDIAAHRVSDSSRVAAESVGSDDRAADGVQSTLLAIAGRERALLADAASRMGSAAGRAKLVVRLAVLLGIVLAAVAYVLARAELRNRLRAEHVLSAREAIFRAAMDGSLDAFYVLRSVRDREGRISDFEFVELNARAEALLGRPRAQLIGQRLCELLPMNRTRGFFERYVHVLDTGVVLEEEFEVTVPDLPVAWIHHQVVPLEDGVAITSRDVTERKRNEEALRALSLVDELTGLYNRRGFLALAEQQLKLAKRGHRDLLLLFIDMDDFKAINDSHGHHEGDIAITRAADILRRTFRDSDIVARLGGDEFVVLAADSNRSSCEAVLARLRSELRERNERDGYRYALSFSVGAAYFDPADSPTIEELLAAADAMLYEQKKQRRHLQLASA